LTRNWSAVHFTSIVCEHPLYYRQNDRKKKRKEKRICIILPLTSAAAAASPLLCSSVLVVSLYISIESFDEARRISSTRSVVVVGAPLLSSPPVYRWDDDDDDEEGNSEHWTQYSNCYSLKVAMCMDIDNGESYIERRGWWTHCCWVLLLWCCSSRGICTSRLCICRFILPSILFVAYLTPGYIIDKPLPIYYYWQCGTMSSSSSSSWLVHTSINIWYCWRTCSLCSPFPLFSSARLNQSLLSGYHRIGQSMQVFIHWSMKRFTAWCFIFF